MKYVCKMHNRSNKISSKSLRNAFSFFGFLELSLQYEGAYLTDGKGLNNWDVFTHDPGYSSKSL